LNKNVTGTNSTPQNA